MASYLVSVSVAGEPPKSREVEKGEKPEDKERRDKDFAESRKRLELRMLRDKARSDWTYVVDSKQVAPLLRGRSEMIAQPKPRVDPRRPPQ